MIIVFIFGPFLVTRKAPYGIIRQLAAEEAGEVLGSNIKRQFAIHGFALRLNDRYSDRFKP